MGHLSVLLPEVLEHWLTDPHGHYVDGTFGGGGHSRAILARLSPRGHLTVLDRDFYAWTDALQLSQSDQRVTPHHANFDQLSSLVGGAEVQGLLLDLGVSSMQLDQAEKGFSFQADGPLDMRMDHRQPLTAALWLNSAAEAQIADVLFWYGNERFSRRIAHAIVEWRSRQPFSTTFDLSQCVLAALPKERDWQRIHPATRTFQAVRIYINQELQAIENLLQQLDQIIAPGGRVVVLSFHSLEDTLIKRFVQSQRQRWRFLVRLLKPCAEEIRLNPRARSAIMRVLEKQP